MKEKAKIFFKIVIVFLLIVGSFFIGKQFNSKQTAADPYKSSLDIAVVNQDLGVEYKGNSVNYAVDFINSIGDGFVLTNREAGKEGKDSGKYGAVVIIPGNFSKNITTINDVTPAKVEIYYELNKNLSKEDRLIIEGKIANLEKNLNNKLSYMYVSSVFDEVHKAQDYVEDILKNDEDDLQAINAINNVDLLNAINLTTLEDNGIEIADLDLSENFSENENIVGEIEEKYEDLISNRENKLDDIRDELVKATGSDDKGIKSYRSKIENMTDEQLEEFQENRHTYNYDNLVSNYETNVDEFRNYLQVFSKEEGTIDQILDVYEKQILDSININGNRSLQMYNDNLQNFKESSSKNLDAINNNALNYLNKLEENLRYGNGQSPKLDSLNEEYLLYSQIVKEFRKTYPSEYQNVCYRVQNKVNVDYSKILKNPLLEKSSDNVFNSGKELDLYMDKLAENNADYELERSFQYKGVNANDSERSANMQIINDCKNDLNGVGNSLQESINFIDTFNDSSEYKYMNDLFGDINLPFSQKIKLDEALTYKIKEQILDGNENQLFDTIRKNNELMVDDVKEKVETEVENVIDYDGPIDINLILKTFDENYLSKFDGVIKKIDDLENDPFKFSNNAEIQMLWNNYRKCNETLNSLTNEKMDNYKKMVDEKFEKADLHVTEMKDNLENGIEAANNQISESIDTAKTTKQDNYYKNYNNLSNLSQVLSNTRLGTVENSDIYNFIVDPLTTIRSENIAAKINASEMDQKNYELNIIKILIVIGIAAPIIGCIYNKKLS